VCSYSETEQFEEAVRDYEKVCKMDRSRGKLMIIMPSSTLITVNIIVVEVKVVP